MKTEEFNRLLDKMISLLIQCSKLTALHLDIDFRLPKDKLEIIFKHLGPQLVELYCDDHLTLVNSYEFSMKYLDPTKIRKLAVDSGSSYQECKQFFAHFFQLTFFKHFPLESLRRSLNPPNYSFQLFNVKLCKLLPNLTEIDITTNSKDPILQIISQSVFAPKLISLQLSFLDRKSDYSFFANFKSLRHLQFFSPDKQSLTAIVTFLPQLESFFLNMIESDDSKYFLILISRLKNLKILKLSFMRASPIKLALTCMSNVIFLIIEFMDEMLIKMCKPIVSCFPNLKGLDIKCKFFISNVDLSFFSQLRPLRRLQLHTRYPRGKWNELIIDNRCSKILIQLFCDQKQTEFSWLYSYIYSKNVLNNSKFNIHSERHYHSAFHMFLPLDLIHRSVYNLSDLAPFGWL